MHFTVRTLLVALAMAPAGMTSGRLHAETPAAAHGIAHIGLCWLKQPGNAAERAQVIAGMKTFESIPGVVSVTVGEGRPGGRPSSEAPVDVGVIVTFGNQQDRDAFRTDAIHVKVAKEVVHPLCAKIVTYDIIH